MDVVVTGGAGFIGSHLCERLLKMGHTVTCIDNFSTGNIQNIIQLKDCCKDFFFLEQDITKPFEVQGGIDMIYNLASPASPTDFSRMPIEILAANSLGTKNVLDLAFEKNAKFLQASTSEVYGNPLEHPQRETYLGNVSTIGERSCYDEGKRFSEALSIAYTRMKGVETRIARIFNTFGLKMRKDDGRVVSNFVAQAVTNKPLTVYGDGSQTRSFCFVDDTVEGLIKLMKSNYQKPVNLGNPKEITILEFAKLIIGLSGSKSKIIFKQLPEDDPLKRQPDISIAMEVLNWKPKISMEEGLYRILTNSLTYQQKVK